MTGFFLLSGFCLYRNYSDRDLTELGQYKAFMKKRIIAIFPLYYFIEILYVLFLGKETLVENILLAPIELLGLQNTFTSLSSMTHNGVTWFISCILISYLFFPFLSKLVSQMKNRSRIALIVILALIVEYAALPKHLFGTASIYGNPFYRGIEFTIGILLAGAEGTIKANKFGGILRKKWMLLVEWAVLIIGVTALWEANIAPGGYMEYSCVGLPCFCAIILTSTEPFKWKYAAIGKIVQYLSSITCAVFLAQFFVWKPVNFLAIESNLLRILTVMLICIIIAIAMHELIERPCRRLFGMKGSKGH